MTVGKTHVLVSEYQYIVATPTEARDAHLVQPPNLIDFGCYSNRVTFVVSIVGISGAPTSWSLGVKFQLGLPSADGWIYQNPRWYDLEAEQVASCIIEGKGWGRGDLASPSDGGFGIIANQEDSPSLAAPITVQRTIRDFGQRVRIALDPKFTGGTSPKIRATILAITGD